MAGVLAVDLISFTLGALGGFVGGFFVAWVVGRELCPPPGRDTREAIAEFTKPAPQAPSFLDATGKRRPIGELRQAAMEHEAAMNDYAASATT